MKGDRERKPWLQESAFRNNLFSNMFRERAKFCRLYFESEAENAQFYSQPVHYTREEESFKLVLRGTRNLRHGKLDRYKHFCMLLQFTIQTNKTRRIMQPDAQKL